VSCANVLLFWRAVSTLALIAVLGLTYTRRDSVTEIVQSHLDCGLCGKGMPLRHLEVRWYQYPPPPVMVIENPRPWFAARPWQPACPARGQVRRQSL
jgi:hypothetical protein